ncbi:MAG: glutathione S-transferase family protein [Gammaproteobacteria bacterium]|nr:glutathione S-transferase family protein [Gammaproteobacteria bacterium]
MKLWHCNNARSLRPLWAMEEMGLPYELVVLPFPPRVLQREYLSVNPLGTVPYFTDGDVHMTESTGICHYLVEKYQQHDFGLAPDHPEYGAYLNWLYHSDATLTFPQTIVLRYTRLEPDERKKLVADDYRKWYLSRLRLVNARVEDHEFLCAGRFTIADIAIAYALFLGESLDIAPDYKPQTLEYLERMKAREGFQKAQVAQQVDA